VQIKVVFGPTDGSIECSNSWTRPPVIEAVVVETAVQPNKRAKIQEIIKLSNQSHTLKMGIPETAKILSTIL
jgi:hypothetical protein